MQGATIPMTASFGIAAAPPLEASSVPLIAALTVPSTRPSNGGAMPSSWPATLATTRRGKNVDRRKASLRGQRRRWPIAAGA